MIDASECILIWAYPSWVAWSKFELAINNELRHWRPSATPAVSPSAASSYLTDACAHSRSGGSPRVRTGSTGGAIDPFGWMAGVLCCLRPSRPSPEEAACRFVWIPRSLKSSVRS